MTIKQSSLTNITLIVMSTLTAIAWLVLPQTILIWFWNKLQKPFAWIAHFDDSHCDYYEPLDQDEGQLFNPYELDKGDNATFQWSEDFFGNN